MEFLEIAIFEGFNPSQGVNFGLPKDLVGVDVADAAYDGLVKENFFNQALFVFNDALEILKGEGFFKGLGAENG